MGKHVTKEQFYAVRQMMDKYPKLSKDLIGQLCSISGPTVRRIAHCKTWEEWLRFKREYAIKHIAKKDRVEVSAEQLPGQTEMQDIPMQTAPEKRVKVYFNNGNTAVFPQDRVVFVWCEPPKPSDGLVVVNWDAVAWMREYQEDA